MKVIETVESVIDLKKLDKLIKTHVSDDTDKVIAKIKKWRKRLEKEGSLFVRKRYKMSKKEYQSVLFYRFCFFVDLATTRKHLTSRLEKVK